MSMGFLRRLIGATAVVSLAALTACGGGGDSGDPPFGGTGGGGSTPMGTLSISLTDAPACGFDHAWVTVRQVRVHRSASAGDGDTGWVDIPLPTPSPIRVDLLELNNGALVGLGQVELPAGTYEQLRLVLVDNKDQPMANAIQPTGKGAVELTTPSGAQSGLKINASLTVPAGQVADFAIDFDGCKSFVTAGKSGKILLKPVLSVIPILSAAGQKIQGWLHPSLAVAGTTVSVQSGGVVVRATPPMSDGSGKFVLAPVPLGTYDLVVTANGRATAVVTGVPSLASESVTINSQGGAINPPLSNRQAVGGTVTVNASPVDTGGVVRALQLLAGGPTIEVASDNARSDVGTYAMVLPMGSAVRAPYVAGAGVLTFVPDLGVPGSYQLSATVTRSATVKAADIVLGATPTVQDFAFTAP